MGLEASLDELDGSVRNLDRMVDELADTVSNNTAALDKLLAAIERLAEKPTATVTNTFAKPSSDTFCGFAEGDRVVYIGGAYKTGLFGIVEPHNAQPMLSDSVPVRREDNGRHDRFPAKSTVLWSSVETYKPAERKWYHEEPSGSTSAWNTRVISAAVDEGLTVEFEYKKPYAYSYEDPERKRVAVTVIGKDDTLVNPRFGGIDTDKSEFRNYRFDRVVGAIRVVAS